MLYLAALERFVKGHAIVSVQIRSPFLLRSFEPDIHESVDRRVLNFDRMGKRIVWELEQDLFWVFHLMIAGRFQWRKPQVMPRGKNDLMAVGFEHGTLLMTEASKKKRASLHLVDNRNDLANFKRGGLEVLDCGIDDFADVLRSENRSIKRALTDPNKFSGIGNAYSDEILLEAGLSPFKRTGSLSDDEIERLFQATSTILRSWVETLKKETGSKFPSKVTAFRPQMMAHGKFNEPCPKCQTKIQRVRYSENEMNYCPRCQTGGKVLADRSLSRLLKDEWPKTIEELEEND